MSEGGAAPAVDGRGELIGRLKAKLRDTIQKLRDAEARLTKADTDVAEARKVATEAETKYSVEPLKAEVDRLKGEIRTGKHRAVFNEAATTAGANKDVLDLLWRESGWDASSDEPDAAAIGKAVEGLKGRADLARLFGEAAPAPEIRPAPAKGQGGRDGGSNRVKARASDLGDPDWAWANRQALREKRVDIID